MARLMVASRSMALAMRIADDHDVVEFPVERLADLTPGPDIEAVVLDLGEPSAAMHALDRLRERGFDTRVLIVSGYQPAWNELVTLQIDRVVVVPLPITRAALLDGIDRLLGNAPATPRQGSPAAAPRAQPPGGAGRSQPARPLAAPVTPSPSAAGADAARAGAPAARSAGPGQRPGPPRRTVDLLTPPRGEPTQSPPAGRTGQPRPDQPRPTQPGPDPPRPDQPGAHRAGARGVAPGTKDQEPGRHRPGLSRWLPSGAPRAPQTPPAGTPAQPGPGPGGPPGTARPSPPAATPAAGDQDLFRPVLEPPVPSRSPSARPRNGVSPSRSLPSGAVPAATGRGTVPGRGRDRGDERHPGFTPEHGLRPADAEQPSDVQGWVRALLDRRSELFGVAETAQVLADEVIERGESDAAAVLVPDGTQWRVAGGVGLRPLERRLLLDTSHWLVSEIAVGGRALLIEDTDIVRPRLAGAPLAAWRHLLAVPVPGIRAAVVLARSQEAARFTERDLAAVVPVVAEAGPLLMAALQMRELARVLAPLRDLDAER